MKFKLVDDWKKAHKWFSIHFMIAGTILSGYETAIEQTWIKIPPQMLNALPQPLVTKITMVLFVMGILGRVIKQEKTDA